MIKNKIVYLLFASYSVIFAILYNEYITALITILILCIPLVMFVFLLCTRPFVAVTSLDTDKIIGRDEEITISYQVRNRSFLPVNYLKLDLSCYFEGDEKKRRKYKVALVADSKSEQIVHCHIKVSHCGMFILSCKSFRLFDYLRIFSLRKKCKEITNVMVYPKRYEIEGIFIPNLYGTNIDSDVFSSVKPGDDPSEVFGIRNYQEGDKLQRVHWKLSSKKNQLMIKEFSSPVSCMVDLLLDLYCVEKDKKRMDYLYDILYSLSYHFTLAGILHTITWFDGREKECKRTLIEEPEQIQIAMEEIYQITNREEQGEVLKHYQEQFTKEPMADIFYVCNQPPVDMESYIKPFKEKKLHVFSLREDKELVNNDNIKVSLIEIENMEESLKRVVF